MSMFLAMLNNRNQSGSSLPDQMPTNQQNDSSSITPLRERVLKLAAELIPAELPSWARQGASMANVFLALKSNVPPYIKAALTILETGNPQNVLVYLDRFSDEQIEQFLQHLIKGLEWTLHGDSEH